jgi:hypothetical protein
MRQCELEKVCYEKGSFLLKRTGEKLIAFIEGVKPDMEGVIIDLKKFEGLWVVDKIHDQDIEKYQIKRSWHVGGL